jgi:hypothetical protein
MKCIFVLILLFSGFVQCAVSSMVSFKDPSTSSRKYTRLLLYVNADLQTQEHVANGVIRKINPIAGTTIVSANKIFTPTRKYSLSETKNLLSQHGIEAIIFADALGAASSQYNITIPQSRSETAHTTGSIGTTSFHATTTYRSTGFAVVPVTVLSYTYRVSIYDVSQKKQIWIAEGSTAGYDIKSMISSSITKTVGEIKKSGLINVKRNSPAQKI